MWLNLTKHQQLDIDKIYLFIKDPYESKYQFPNDRIEKLGIQELKNPNAFFYYSQIIHDVYENLEDYNPKKKSVDSIWWYGRYES